jgi:hypothetical protein
MENEENAKTAKENGNEEEDYDYDYDDFSKENLSAVKYDKPIRNKIESVVSELGTMKDFDVEQDIKDGIYDEVIKIANEKDEEGEEEDQNDILAVNEENDEDYDYDEAETDIDNKLQDNKNDQFSRPKMIKLTDKNLEEDSSSSNIRGDGKEHIEFEGEEEESEMHLQEQHYPLGHAWQVKWKPGEDEEEETETQLTNWWELEDAVLVFFEDGIYVLCLLSINHK